MTPGRRERALQRLSTRGRQFAVSTAALLLVAAFGILGWGRSVDYRLEDQEVVASGLIDDAWFTPSGDLATVSAQGSVAHLVIRKHPYAAVGDPSEVYQIATSSSNTLAYARGADPLSASADSYIPYAVAEDALHVGWIEGPDLLVHNVKSGSNVRTRIVLDENVFAVGLSFVRSNKIALVYPDGRLKIWDVLGGRLGPEGSWLEGPWTIWSRGGDLAVSSFASGDLGYLTYDDDSGKLLSFFKQISASEGTALAVSEKGVLGVGTLNGRVIFFESGSVLPSSGMPLERSRAVRAATFMNDREMLVGGDFPGIYLASVDGVFDPMSAAPSGIRLLSFKNGTVAYASEDSLEVAQIERNYGLNDFGSLVLNVVAFVLGVMAIWLSILQDR